MAFQYVAISPSSRGPTNGAVEELIKMRDSWFGISRATGDYGKMDICRCRKFVHIGRMGWSAWATRKSIGDGLSSTDRYGRETRCLRRTSRPQHRRYPAMQTSRAGNRWVSRVMVRRLDGFIRMSVERTGERLEMDRDFAIRTNTAVYEWWDGEF